MDTPFRKRLVKKKSDNSLFLSFTPAVSKTALNAMKDKIRKQRYRKKTEMSLQEIAEECNPILRGWINYYGCFNRSSLYPLFRYVNNTLIKWALRKFKKMKSKTRVAIWLEKINERQPCLFAHWKIGMTGAFA